MKIKKRYFNSAQFKGIVLSTILLSASMVAFYGSDNYLGCLFLGGSLVRVFTLRKFY